MPDDFVVHVDRSVRLSNALVVVAFPSPGNVACIAASFLQDMIGLCPVGGISSPRFPPLVAVHEGAPYPPVEVHAGERACGVNGVCESLVTFTSPVAIPEDVTHGLACAIIDWCRELGTTEIVVLDGISDAGASAADLVGVGSSSEARERLLKNDVALLKDAFLGGIAGVLLERGTAAGLDTYGLLARSDKAGPDPEAAALLVRAVDRILLRSGVDRAELAQNVERVMHDVESRQSAAREQVAVHDVAYL